MSEELRPFEDMDEAEYLDLKRRCAWFFRQPRVCQHCLNLDWYYTQSCVLQKVPRGEHCDWQRKEEEEE